MTLTNPLTTQDTYLQYLKEIGVKPSKKIERSFACGLPAVWLYLKSIGLEKLFFELLAQSKKRPETYKELFYLMILTNGQNKFFPHIPKDFLKNRIPDDIAAAQVEIDKADFAMTFSFTAEQLKETLEAISKPNVMIRLGNQRKTIGIMFSDNAYHVYHADNPNALHFKSIDRCVELIMRVINENSDEVNNVDKVNVKVEAYTLKGMPKPKFPDSRELYKKFITQYLKLSKGIKP